MLLVFIDTKDDDDDESKSTTTSKKETNERKMSFDRVYTIERGNVFQRAEDRPFARPL